MSLQTPSEFLCILLHSFYPATAFLQRSIPMRVCFWSCAVWLTTNMPLSLMARKLNFILIRQQNLPRLVANCRRDLICNSELSLSLPYKSVTNACLFLNYGFNLELFLHPFPGLCLSIAFCLLSCLEYLSFSSWFMFYSRSSDSPKLGPWGSYNHQRLHTSEIHLTLTIMWLQTS